MNKLFDKLFIFEIANNHMGSVQHGLNIIRNFYEVSKNFTDFKFGFKLQYRNLDTFIHPDYKERMDIKYIKRFTETELLDDEFITLKNEIDRLGFISICTPFDETSVELVEKHGFDIIKIGSSSFTDWNLLERISKTNKPIIASTAGASLNDIDRVVSFFEHRNKDFCLMHCVGEYPTIKDNLELNQIDFLSKRYPNITIGYSTHEDPDNVDAIKIVISKGAKVFERHVGLISKYPLNNYSSTPYKICRWLDAAEETFMLCGVSDKRRECSTKELMDLNGLKRGIFAKRNLVKDEKLTLDNTFFAIPNIENQLLANDFSKYTEFVVENSIEINKPILFKNVITKNLRERLFQIAQKVKDIFVASKINLSNKIEFELSHHYGIDKFEQYGAVIINCINREYCKKLIIVLPNQKHPIHYHLKKEETFHVLYGNITISLDNINKEYKTGDMIIVERNVRHGWKSKNGAIFEEISTTHFNDDSFYDDKLIEQNKNRKTTMTLWSNWLIR